MEDCHEAIVASTCERNKREAVFLKHTFARTYRCALILDFGTGEREELYQLHLACRDSFVILNQWNESEVGMTVRKRKTPQQLIEMHKRKASALEKKVKNVEKAKRTRQLILHGEALVARAAAGDPVSQAEVARNLAGLTRKHDRAAFDLEPLPEPGPDDHLPVNPPAPVTPPAAASPLDLAVARRKRAVEAWNVATTEKNRIELGDAIAAWEELTAVLWGGIEPEKRLGFDLGDGPGVVLRTA
jgi:hypothetical protein